MEQIYYQKLPEPEQKPTPLHLISSILYFLVTNIILLPLYFFYLILLSFGGMVQIQSTEADYGTALFALALAIVPLILAFRQFYGYGKKHLFHRIHLPTYEWLSIVWVSLLSLYAFAAIVPNNPIASTVTMVQRQVRYEDQWKETQIHLPKLEGETPFYVATNLNTTISLFYAQSAVYVQYEDGADSLAVLPFQSLGELEQNSNTISVDGQSYEVIYLLRTPLPTGEEVAIHTTAYGGELIIQVADQYYRCDTRTVALNPESNDLHPDGAPASAAYITTITKSLYNAVPINPMDDDSIIYGHLPYYDLFPSVEFDFPWLGYEIIDSFLPTPAQSVLTGKASDQEGENYLSARTGALSDTYLRGNDPLYTLTEHVFETQEKDSLYYYFLVHDGTRYVRASNYVFLSKEQYEKGDW